MNSKLQRIIATTIVLTFLSVSLLWAQQNDEDDRPIPPATPEVFPEYGLGDQMLAINLGIMAPLFFAGGPDGIQNTNLSLGGLGSLEWASYLNNNVALGMELGGAFAFTPNGRALFMVPITAKISYVFRSYPFSFPVFLGAGLNISRLEDQTKFDPILKPGASFYWTYNPEWSFGLNTTYWWVPQFYRGPEPPSGDTRYGNFLEISLSALYHF